MAWVKGPESEWEFGQRLNSELARVWLLGQTLIERNLVSTNKPPFSYPEHSHGSTTQTQNRKQSGLFCTDNGGSYEWGHREVSFLVAAVCKPASPSLCGPRMSIPYLGPE